MKNPVLKDIWKYRQARLQMNNPKGWDHVYRKASQAREFYLRAFDRATVDRALYIVHRLARLEKNG